MRRKSILILLIVLVCCTGLWTCNKEISPCSDDQSFCSLVDNQNFDATGSIIDTYLAGLEGMNDDEKLNNLRNWLECKSCIDHAQIICNSCIKTNPPISELRVDFLSSGQNITMILDISMEEPLKYVAYHL